MVTGGFRVVLLAVCLAVAATSIRDEAELPTCERSALHLVMRDLHHCTTDPIADSYRYVTVAEIARVAQDYCTVTIPNGLSCFQDEIRECNATLEAKVSQLAERGVGLFCQPGGAGVNPAISAVLDSIDDGDLLITNRHRCPDTLRSIYKCRRQMAHLHENARLVLDDLVAWMQRTASKYVACSLRVHKMAKDTCPYWKAAFFHDIRFLLERNLLGVQMPEELARELEMLTEA